MTQHVDEVKHDHVQVVFLQTVQLLHQSVGIHRVVHLMIGKGVLPAVAVQLRLDERFFVQVLAFLLVLVHPEIRKHLRNLIRHQTREDGVTGILRSRRKDTAIELLVDLELVTEFA